MIFSFEETPNSRSETDTPPTYTLEHILTGTMDDELVQTYALAATPHIVARPGGVLYKQDVRKTPAGWMQWHIVTTYGKREKKNTPVGSYTFSFDTTGATINIKAAKEHVATYPVDGDWHKGAIGVKSDGEVDGADIVIPALKINYTFKHPLGVVNEDHARYLADATGHTNEYEWRGFLPGELLYLGSTGSDGSEAEATVDYIFAASSNTSSLNIGEITGIVKQGHHYVWVEFKDEVHSNEPVRQPNRVHVERVYDPIDFATVFGWS